jgi:hypothetical protein
MLFGIIYDSMHYFLFIPSILLYVWNVTLCRSILDATFVYSAIVLFVTVTHTQYTTYNVQSI